jgi:D-alanyl-D-alanine carboxypeptidase
MIGMDAHCAQVFGGKTGTTKVAGTGMTVLTINENGHEIITCVCGIPYDVADHQTVYIAAIVREANLKCWESDPVHRVDGNVIDNRGYNSPKEQGPSGSKGNVTVSSPESTEETLAPTETTQAPSVTEASSVTPAPQAEKKGFMEKHPVLVIVLAVLSTIVVIMIILTIISVSRVKKRRKTGIRKVRF